MLWKKGAPTLYDIQYEYDPAGNRTLKETASDTEYPDYDASDELVDTDEVRFEWDRVGRLVEKADPADAAPTKYAWNYAHRLRQVTLPDGSTAKYRYNGDELRTWRKAPDGTVTNAYWVPQEVLGLVQVLNETDGAGNRKADSILGPNGVIGIVDSGGNDFYYLFDAFGSVLALTDATGAVTDMYTYDEYGVLTASSGTTYNPLRFTGQQYDAETGFYNLRNRYYVPEQGRFVRRDSGGTAVGLGVGPIRWPQLGQEWLAGLRLSGAIRSGQAMSNRYVYTGNRPTDFVDSTGLAVQIEVMVGGFLLLVILWSIWSVASCLYRLGKLNDAIEENKALLEAAVQNVLKGMLDRSGRLWK